MKLIKEPKDVDFIIQSAEWSEKDLMDFRNIMLLMKARKNRGQFLNKQREPNKKT